MYRFLNFKKPSCWVQYQTFSHIFAHEREMPIDAFAPVPKKNSKFQSARVTGGRTLDLRKPVGSQKMGLGLYPKNKQQTRSVFPHRLASTYISRHPSPRPLHSPHLSTQPILHHNHPLFLAVQPPPPHLPLKSLPFSRSPSQPSAGVLENET